MTASPLALAGLDNQPRRPSLILPARLNIPTRLSAAPPSTTTSLLRHQNLMQNSHTILKLIFQSSSTARGGTHVLA